MWIEIQTLQWPFPQTDIFENSNLLRALLIKPELGNKILSANNMVNIIFKQKMLSFWWRNEKIYEFA